MGGTSHKTLPCDSRQIRELYRERILSGTNPEIWERMHLIVSRVKPRVQGLSSTRSRIVSFVTIHYTQRRTRLFRVHV